MYHDANSFIYPATNIKPIMLRRSLYLLIFLLANSIGAALAAPPSAPTNICIEHSDEVQCTTSITPAGSTGGTRNIIAPKSVNPDKFHPGFYLSVGLSQETPSAAFSILIDNPIFTGGKRIYAWKDIEPSEGKYDFSKIEQDLTYLKSIGKRLWIQVFYTQFNGDLSPLTPSYMWKNSTYGCGPQYYGSYERSAQTGGWIPCFWNNNVNSKLRALYTALGNRFNKEEYLEGISLDETAIDTSAAKNIPGYSPAIVYAAFKENALATKQAFPDKVVIQQINYAPYDLVDYSSWLIQKQIGIGSPDVILHNTTLTGTIYPQYSTYHNDVPTGPDVQWSNYEQNNPETGRSYNAEEILTGMINISNPWYMFWIKREPYFSNDVLPTLIKYGNLPAAKAFYDSMGITN
jgi:hypothetical protein